MKWLLSFLGLAAVLVFLPMLWSGGRTGALNLVGSTSVEPFAELLAEQYHKIHRERYVDVQGGGSTAGLQAADTGIADIGTCSRSLSDEESKTYTAVTIARDGLAVIVHPTNRVSDLTLDQIRRIFVGDVVNWKDVGGADRPIRLISREEGSGTREAFQKLVMGKNRVSRKALTQESNGAVKELVRHDPNAVGYMSLGLVGEELKTLRIGGAPATVAEVKAGRYPLVRPFLFVSKGPPSQAAQAFIDYVLSEEGQRTLEKEGLVSAK